MLVEIQVIILDKIVVLYEQCLIVQMNHVLVILYGSRKQAMQFLCFEGRSIGGQICGESLRPIIRLTCVCLVTERDYLL